MSRVNSSAIHVDRAIGYTLPTQMPNILLIVTDAFRATHMSALGYERPTTPNLDRLAAEGVLFEQAISPGSWSLPTHASLFTGLYVSRHGAHDEHRYLSDIPEHVTLAQRLKAAGYATWAYCENSWVGSLTGLDRGFETFTEHFSNNRRERLLRYTIKGWARLSDTADSGAQLATVYAKRFIRRASRSTRPFFMFMQYLEPHAPYRLPRGWRHKFLPSHIPYQEAIKVNQDPNAYIAGKSKMTGHDFAILRDLYDSEIAYMDSRIGELVDYLDAHGLRESTLVIITADHGENLGDHSLMAHKFCLYETLIHVPLILRMPGRINEKQRVSYQVQTHDIVPTIYDLAGLKIDAHIQAKSLLRRESNREFTIAEKMLPNLSKYEQRYPDFDTTHLNRRLKAFRTERYKLIWASDGRHELYDLQTDPHETQNLINKLPDIGADLESRLMEWCSSFEAAHTLDDDVTQMNDQVVERLRSLGYLE